MFTGSDGMNGFGGMMGGWGMGVGMIAILALIFLGAVAIGYILGTRR